MDECVWSNGGMLLTEENWSAGRETLYNLVGRWMNDYGAIVEWHWQGKLKYSRKKPVPVPLCAPKIPLGMIWVRICVCAVTGSQITIWTIAWPHSESHVMHTFVVKKYLVMCMCIHIHIYIFSYHTKIYNQLFILLWFTHMYIVTCSHHSLWICLSHLSLELVHLQGLGMKVFNKEHCI